MLSGNSSGADGGGAQSGILNNCTLIGNSARANGGGAANWDERELYVMTASTDEALAEKMQLETTGADDVPEIGKIVGIENGSCTAVCHKSIEQEGDFWKVRGARTATAARMSCSR